MEDKDLKRLSRSELLDIIYTLRKNQDTLEQANAEMREALERRELKVAEAGSVAEASLAVTNIFEEAQKAADAYLDEIRRRHDNADAFLSQTATLLDQAMQLLDQSKAAVRNLEKSQANEAQTPSGGGYSPAKPDAAPAAGAAPGAGTEVGA